MTSAWAAYMFAGVILLLGGILIMWLPAIAFGIAAFVCAGMEPKQKGWICNQCETLIKDSENQK
jgi:hypothetical protein